MGRQYKQKSLNVFTAWGDLIASGIQKTKEIVSDAKYALDSPEVKRTKVILHFVKLGYCGDITQIHSIMQTMFPLKCRGIKIDYGDRYPSNCPAHGTPAFRTNHPKKVWCPLCMDFLDLK